MTGNLTVTHGIMIVIDYFWLFAPLLISAYFLYRMRTEQKLKGVNGIGVGIFLVQFIHGISPMIAKWVKVFFLSR